MLPLNDEVNDGVFHLLWHLDVILRERYDARQVVVNDHYRRSTVGTQHGAAFGSIDVWAEEVDVELLVLFECYVVDDLDLDDFVRLTGAEREGTFDRRVVGLRVGGAVTCLVVDRCGGRLIACSLDDRLHGPSILEDRILWNEKLYVRHRHICLRRLLLLILDGNNLVQVIGAALPLLRPDLLRHLLPNRAGERPRQVLQALGDLHTLGASHGARRGNSVLRT
mmetsp:Transcript_30683/g.69908  ORF Transcript_30683/g.69908 Transcript_30683/m.69908 type:complete len:223 (-) Transcript_30683:527-1195(-)